MNTRTPVVLPAVELDAHLHEQAAKLTRRRHSTQTRNLGTESPAQTLAVCNHDDDPMTPPDVLLRLWLDRSKEYTKSRNEAALDGWIRCTALARVVHNDSHWVLAMAHVQLALEYMRRGWTEQALRHASQGRDILLSPSSHMLSPDPPPEAVYNLSLAHYVIGHVLVTQKKLKEAEKSLLQSEKSSEQYSHLSDDDAVTQLDLDIASAIGRLSLEQGRYSLAKDCYQKAIDLSKASRGAHNSCLVALLRGLASATLKDSGDKALAVAALQEALEAARLNFGANSEEVGDTLMCLGRVHTTEGPSDTVEVCFQKACSVYTHAFDQYHKKTVSCKEELCRYLSTKPDSQKRALTMIKELIKEQEITHGESSIEVGESLKLLGTVQLTQGEMKQAAKTLRKAKDVYSTVVGAKHRETANIGRTLELIAGSGGASGRTRDSKPVFKTVV